MSQFNYIVRTKDGVRQEGTIDAENINIASEKLRTEGMIVVKIDERDSSFEESRALKSPTFCIDFAKDLIAVSNVVIAVEASV